MPTQVLNPAQRRYLKQLSHHLKPLLQIGKEGASQAFIRNLSEQIDIHELIKVRILGNCLAEDEEIRAALNAAGMTIVQKVGNIFTVFKQREEDSKITLPRA